MIISISLFTVIIDRALLTNVSVLSTYNRGLLLMAGRIKAALTGVLIHIIYKTTRFIKPCASKMSACKMNVRTFKYTQTPVKPLSLNI